MKKQIVIYLPEEEYGERFAKYMKQTWQTPYEVNYFSNSNECIKFLKEVEADLVIQSESNSLETALLLGVRETVILTEEPPLEQEESSQLDSKSATKIKKVYQYQSMEEILASISPNSAKHQETTNQITNELDADIVSILVTQEPYYGLVKVHMALESLKTQEQTIVVDLTQFSFEKESTSKGMVDRETFGMSDVIYYLEDGRLCPEVLGGLITKRKGYDAITCVNHCLDLLELNQEHMKEFLAIIEQCGYKRIIIITSIVTQAIIEGLQRSKGIFYLCNNQSDSMEAKVREQFTRLLSKECMEHYHEIKVGEEKESVISLRNAISQ